MSDKAFSSDLVRSCADLVILTLLLRKPMHGYDILTSMSGLGDGRLRFKHGTLYPLLYRLEREGWVSAKWQVPAKGKRRKVYRITADGRRVQAKRIEQWQAFTTSVDAIFKECSDA